MRWYSNAFYVLKLTCILFVMNYVGKLAHSRSTLEVPIFWFIHVEPLLVDKHYQAKALSDMVIVVQSEPPFWESHLQCNGQPLLWDLRLEFYFRHMAISESSTLLVTFLWFLGKSVENGMFNSISCWLNILFSIVLNGMFNQVCSVVGFYGGSTWFLAKWVSLKTERQSL